MDVERINKLEDLIPLDENSTIIDQKVKRLTAAGENYGSLMLSVDITIKTPKGNDELHAVAKMVPPNEFLQQVFNTQVTFRNEIGFYKNIVPALQNFQREQGMVKLIDFFPKYIGSRLNLTGDNTKVDSDAVILLENLKVSNYQNLEKTKGFDLETSKLIIIDLAHLHAVPIALKLKKPQVFDKEIRPYLSTPQPPKSSGDDLEKLLGLIESIDDCKQYFQRAKHTIEKVMDTMDLKRITREPFATISHNDVWVNNTMVKIEEGKVVKNKLVDFQVCDYGSPAKDLIFFLFSSVENDILVKHCDDLIKFYHENFIRILEDLNCSTVEFSYNDLLKEIKCEVDREFVHNVFMCFPIFMPKDNTTELDEFKPEDFMKSVASPPKKHTAKLSLIITEFAKRNWI